jgi:hypothetical protein
MRERWGHVLARDPYYNPNLSRSSEDFALRGDTAPADKRDKDRAAAP